MRLRMEPTSIFVNPGAGQVVDPCDNGRPADDGLKSSISIGCDWDGASEGCSRSLARARLRKCGYEIDAARILVGCDSLFHEILQFSGKVLAAGHAGMQHDERLDDL